MPLPIEISARHIHLSQSDLEKLFGAGYSLKKLKNLTQGQIACKETLVIKGPKSQIENVRIVGPVVSVTKVAITLTDAYNLGLTPPLKDCHDQKPGALITLIFGQNQIQVLGAIIPQRHIYLDPKSAAKLNLSDGGLASIKLASIKTKGPRKVTFHNVLVKVKEDATPCFRLDVDEANAAGVKSGDWGEIVR